MNNKPLTRLSIDGKFIDTFNHIELKQSINDHHSFKIILDHDTVETIGGHTIDKSKEWLSKPVVITFDETDFLGIITHIELKNKNGHHGKLILQGASPTILLQGQPHFTSWTNKTLQQIVLETVQSLELGKNIHPTFKEPLEYESQYNENHFQFLQRLAKQYQQWFYYNGVGLVFGKPAFNENVVYIEYGSDVNNLDLKIKIKDTKQKKVAYNPSTNQLLYAEAKGQVDGFNELAWHAFNSANSKFNNETLSLTNTQTNSKYLIDRDVELQQAQTSANLHTLKGKSHKQGLTIGSVIKINSVRTVGKNNIDKQNYGEYVITEITHKASLGNKYQNKFTAIPSGITVPKAPKVKLPLATPQIATVTDNEDKQGRVKVRFLWQAYSQQTAWIRVASPNAGSSKHHQQNRGHVFIPEIDDQVMVGFEHHNPNKPFVLGSLFHGQNGAGGKANNNIKSIVTKSGNEIIFNDGDGKGSIHVNSPSGNSIHLQGDGSITAYNRSGNSMFMDNDGNINFNAPKSLTFNSKRVTFNVADIMQLNVMQKMLVSTPWLSQLVTDFYHTQAGKALINSENEIKIESPQLFAVGQKKLFLHSDELATLNSKGIAEFKGEKGNKHTNTAEVFQIVQPEIEAKAVVNFRPHSAWAGEFGFDWMRVKDTSIDGDIDYETEVGTYTGLDANGNVIYATEVGATFTPDVNSFNSLENEYKPTINIKGKTNAAGNQVKYYTPWLSIYREPNATTAPTAELELQVEVEIEPDEIYLEYPKKYFEIAGQTAHPTDANIMQFKLPASTYAVTTNNPNKTNITIKCIHTLELDKTIDAYAVKNKPDGSAGEPKLAGKLKAKANNKANRRISNIVFVNVITNINGTVKDGILAPDKTAQEDYLRPFLRQALVDPLIINKDLNLSDTTKTEVQTLNSNYTIATTAGSAFNKYHNTRGISLVEFLENTFNADPANTIYQDYYKVFFLGEIGVRHNSSGGLTQLGGHANGVGSKECVMYANPDNFFVSHELMHCMGLYHSFDNDGAHVFPIGQTENIMDYSHISSYAVPNGVLTQISTWVWQWSTLISSNELEP